MAKSPKTAGQLDAPQKSGNGCNFDVSKAEGRLTIVLQRWQNYPNIAPQFWLVIFSDYTSSRSDPAANNKQ